ncbi:MAG: hypothetical protein IME98_02275 [Proteobacteria bacterium]|nr:hypothetical protein [Pseudomonadota bacterium]
MGNAELESQRKGIEFTKEGKYDEALELLTQNDSFKSHPVSMSCYALCKAAIEFDIKSTEKLCRQALRLERSNPIIYLCMGRIYLLSGDKGLAYKVFKYGLKYSRKNKELLNELAIFGKRRSVLFPSHKRDHFLNRSTGILSLWLAMDIGRYLPFQRTKDKNALKGAVIR